MSDSHLLKRPPTLVMYALAMLVLFGGRSSGQNSEKYPLANIVQGIGWEATGGPPGGNVLALFHESGRSIAASGSGAIYILPDGGSRWQRLTDRFSGIAAMTIDGAGDYYVIDQQHNLDRSMDAGVTWTRIRSFPNIYYAPQIAVSGNGTVIVHTDGRYQFRSSDYGATWGRDSLLGWMGLWPQGDANGYLYGKSGSQIFRSTDKGILWQPIVAAQEIVVGDHFLAARGGYPYTTDNWLEYTPDGGNSWKTIPLPPDTMRQSMTLLGIDDRAGIYFVTARYLTRPDTVITRFFRIDTSGRMERLPLGYAAGIYGLTAIPGRGFILRASFGLIVSLDYGATYRTTIDGFNASYVGTLAIAPNGKLYCRPGRDLWYQNMDLGVFRFEENTWTATNPAYNGYFTDAVAVSPSGTIIAGGFKSIYRSEDEGVTWTKLADSMRIASWAPVSWIFAPTESVIFAWFERYGATTFLRSIDGGKSWGGTGLPSGAWAITSSENPALLYAGIRASTHWGVYRSTDTGATWAQVGLLFASITSLATRDSTVIAATDLGTYRSTNYGGDWTLLDSLKPKRIRFDPRGVLVALTDTKVLYWDVPRARWLDATPQSLSLGITDIVFDRTGTAYLATAGAGVWRSTTTLGIAAEPRREPGVFSLSQNYPNPFNPTTDIGYRIADIGSRSSGQLVTLKVYNILGQEVATLVDEVKSAGTYSVKWDGGKAPSGVYFYKLTAGYHTQVRKMLLVR